MLRSAQHDNISQRHRAVLLPRQQSAFHLLSPFLVIPATPLITLASPVGDGLFLEVDVYWATARAILAVARLIANPTYNYNNPLVVKKAVATSLTAWGIDSPLVCFAATCCCKVMLTSVVRSGASLLSAVAMPGSL